jgi:ferredoxin
LNEVRFTAIATGWPPQQVTGRCGDALRDALRELAAFPLTCGDLSCGACHIYVPRDLAAVPMGTAESELIDLADAPRRSGSRLACQVRITQFWEDAVVEIATPARRRP